MNKDIVNNSKTLIAFDALGIFDNTTLYGNVIDLNDALDLKFEVICTDYTDGDYQLNVQVSNDNTFATGVTTINCAAGSTDKNAIVSDQTILLTAANLVSVFGIIPDARYCRLEIIPTNVTTGATIVALAVTKPRFKG